MVLNQDYLEIQIPSSLQELIAHFNYKKYLDLILISRPNKKKPNLDKHHILPKCKGGKDSRDNIIWLTREEHVNAHRLLFLENLSDIALQRAYCACISFNKEYTLPEESRFVFELKQYQMKNFNPMKIEKSRLVLSQARLGDKNPACKPDTRVALYTDETKSKIKRLFYSAFEAAEYIFNLGLSNTQQAAAVCIRYACRNQCKHAYKMYWSYITDAEYRALIKEKYLNDNL